MALGRFTSYNVFFFWTQAEYSTPTQQEERTATHSAKDRTLTTCIPRQGNLFRRLQHAASTTCRPLGFNARRAGTEPTTMPVPHDTLPRSKHDAKTSRIISNDSPAALIPTSQVLLPPVQNVTRRPKKEVQWNTARVGLRLGADFTSAASAAALIAPIITVIDRYVFDLSTTLQ